MNIDKLFRLDGKTAIVTGASGAIGGAIARGFAHFGANLALCYNRNRKRMEELIEDIRALPGMHKAYQVDSRDRDSIAAHAEDVMRDFGSIDIVVNVAGGNRPGAVYTGGGKTIFELAPEDQLDVVILNLFGGAIWPCLLYGKKMLNNPAGGSIINIGSPPAGPHRLCRGQGGHRQLHHVAGLPSGQRPQPQTAGQQHRSRFLPQLQS